VCDDRESFLERLRDEKPVERIPVVGGSAGRRTVCAMEIGSSSNPASCAARVIAPRSALILPSAALMAISHVLAALR